MKSFVSGLLFVCVAVASIEAIDIKIGQTSVKGHLFEPLRANKQPVTAIECGKQVTEPLGILKQEYKKGVAKPTEQCIWHLHAPANHVISINSEEMIFESDKPQPDHPKVLTTSIKIYDASTQKNLLDTLYAEPRMYGNGGAFISSISSGQDMTVEFNYADLKDYTKQTLLVNYQFLPIDEMRKLLG